MNEFEELKESVKRLETIIRQQKRGETFDEEFSENLIRVLSTFSDRITGLEEQIGEKYPIDLNENEVDSSIPEGCRPQDFLN